VLSKRSQYALKALSYLTEKYQEGPVLISEIAKKKKIPLKFLENILLELKLIGVLDSKSKSGRYHSESKRANCNAPMCKSLFL